MRKLRLLTMGLAVAAALSIGACTTAQLTDAADSVVNALGSDALSASSTTTQQSTAMAQAEIAFTAAAVLEKAWLQSGKATPAQATVAKALREALYADIVAGRTAVANNDSPGIAVALNLFNQALPQFRAYIAKNGGGT